MPNIADLETWKELYNEIIQSRTLPVMLGFLAGLLVKHMLTKSRNSELAALNHQFAIKLEGHRSNLSVELETLKGEIKTLGDLLTLKRSRFYTETANSLIGIYEKFVELDQLAGILRYAPVVGADSEKLTRFRTLADEAEYSCFRGRIFWSDDLFEKCKQLSNECQLLGEEVERSKRSNGLAMEGELAKMKAAVKERMRPLFDEIRISFRKTIEG